MRRYAISALAVSLLTCAMVSAQSDRGTLAGVVKDPTGNILPGVTVTMTRADGIARTTVTDQNGEFRFAFLEPGRYTVTAMLPGFATQVATVTIRAGQTATLAISMKGGVLEESVTVEPVPLRRPDAKHALPQSTVHGVVAGVPALEAPPVPPRPRFNTEAYDRINDNPWMEVARHPLSTFSTDVDTASYSNVRRFLNQGQAPPTDAVRIEELINYFSFNYAEPRDDKPVSITAAIGDCPWNPEHRLALIGLQARRIDASRIPPRNLVFLIDVSGSMMPANKLPLVKASLAMLAPNLTANDRVAIVVYAGASGLVLPSTAGNDTSTIVDALHRLEAGGSTNGAQGLVLAYRVAQEHFISRGVNRVILATDGDFNVGVTDQGSLLRLIEEKRESGIALSVLGYGMGNVKDSTLEKLADAGNGNYAYIDSLDEAQKVLVEQAGGTLVTVAKDVKLQVEFNPRVVGAYRLIGYENRLLRDQDFNDDKKDAGDMGAGHSVTALYELVPAGQAIASAPIDPLKYQQRPVLSSASKNAEAMTVKIRYKQPDGDTSSLISVATPAENTESPELGFAAAVVEFGMLLRDSEFKGSSSFAVARTLAEKHKGSDEYGHRAEFIRLIGAAEGIVRLQTAAR